MSSKHDMLLPVVSSACEVYAALWWHLIVLYIVVVCDYYYFYVSLVLMYESNQRQDQIMSYHFSQNMLETTFFVCIKRR